MARECYRIDDLTVDVGAVTVTRRDETIVLPGLSFDLLVALARRAPDAVDTPTLIEDVWQGTVVSDETVTQRVALVRRALGDDASRPRYVRSIRGKGYALVPEVTAVGLDPASRRWRAWGLAAVLTMVLLIVPVGRWIQGALRPDTADQPITRSASVDERVARADAYRARHQDADNELAVELYEQVLDDAPDHVGALSGLSLALSQRVTKFNRSTKDRARALSLAERALTLDRGDGDAHYARALALDSTGRIREALLGYQRADALGATMPSLASAAYGHQVLGQLARALEANLAAYSRFPDAPYVEVQIASTLGLLGFDDAAVVWFERALALRPDNVFAALSYAQYRLSKGRLDETERLARGAIEAGIRRAELHTVLGHVSMLRGDGDAAAQHYRDALGVQSRACEAATHLWRLDQGASDFPNRPPCYQAADVVFPDPPQLEYEDPRPWITAATAHAAAGDGPRALAWLDHGIDRGYRNTGWLLLDPLLRSLHDEPGFLERIEQIREHVEAERRAVLAADWLPEDFLVPRTSQDR